jgi:hypothetical protein
MSIQANTRNNSVKHLLGLAEHALSAFAQVLYTTLPLIILLIVTAILGGADVMAVVGGSEAMFVAVIAFIDASRDSIRAVSLQSDKGDTEKVDTMAVLSIILVVMGATALVLSVAVDKSAVVMTAQRHKDLELFCRTTLAVALGISWIYKWRLKCLEEKLAKKAPAENTSPASHRD